MMVQGATATLSCVATASSADASPWLTLPVLPALGQCDAQGTSLTIDIVQVRGCDSRLRPLCASSLEACDVPSLVLRCVSVRVGAGWHEATCACHLHAGIRPVSMQPWKRGTGAGCD